MSDDWKFSIEEKENQKKPQKIEIEPRQKRVGKLKLDFDNAPKTKSRAKYVEEDSCPDENVWLSNFKYYLKKIMISILVLAALFYAAKYFNLL